MLSIGITGHRTLPSAGQWTWVRSQLLEVLSAVERPYVGLSSLAAGADQLFAEIVLEVGGELAAIIPCEDYERTFDDDVDVARFRRLLGAAERVEMLDGECSDETFLAAGQRIVAMSTRLVAVWDGLPARGMGGTAQIVEFAQRAGVPVIHINPATATVGAAELS